MEGHLGLMILILSLSTLSSANPSRTQQWAAELTGVDETIPMSEAQRQSYKQNLLQYVFHTQERPSVEELGQGTRVPYVMNKLYELLADKETGRARENSPFDVDYIRGLLDHEQTERRMQFWFNCSVINATEDIIEAYFHIYKSRAPTPVGLPRNTPHRITVSLYKIIDSDTVYAANGSVGEGVVKLQQHQVSAYSSEWVVFNVSLRETVKEWVRHPEKNKGFLITATDPDENHVNGTHINFVQRGENPQQRQPVFAVYTDHERKRKDRTRRKLRDNIDFLVDNFLNEDVNREELVVQDQCRMAMDSRDSYEECTTVVMRRRRALLDEDNGGEENAEIDDGYDDEWEDNSVRSRKSLSNTELIHQATQRNNNYCQRKNLTIDFRVLGWEKWIVQPTSFEAGYCDGDCPFPLTGALPANNHAVLQSIANFYRPDDVKKPCCVPQKLGNLSILYHEKDAVIFKTYRDMVVSTCGCL